ncbi:helix-turn-helix transcriptional regulator [Pseudanabaena sp. 'Roaring Creek']|uniref:helix-turn-helix transcriptional regulator n=1 Tax=Pseudanabaena sp. 'Roaring Creek' TaxID=1681830 RepID=UPI0006D8448A|nr:helix-turn-helix transcriptional regulator [Pseudanabaena sp. 'Roaring Creek']
METKISPLAMLRRLRGDVTQDEIANALGVDRNTVSRWELGKAKPKLEVWQVKKLCELLDVTLDDLPDSFAPQPVHLSFDKPTSKG